MKIKVFNKFISLIATTALLINSLSTPLLVLAQTEPTPTPFVEELTPSPEATVVPSETPVPTEEPTPTPTDMATPTPETIATPTPESEPTVYPTPESTPETQNTTDENSLATAPPSDSPTTIPTPVATTVQPLEQGDLSATIVENTNPFPESVENYDWFKVITDKLDYAPTEAAIITGTNFIAGETYTLTVSSSDDPATSTTVEVTADLNGSFTYVYQLDGIYRPNYLVEVKEGEVVIASTTFTDANPSADLDQYGNDAPAGWQNGNLNANQATYLEGDSVPYRLKLDNLDTSISHTVTISWDTTKSGKHALDYLTTYNRTQSADPCAGVAGCGSPTTYAIPVDPNVTKGQDGILGNSDDITQIPGNFTLYNGTITGVSAYSLSGLYSGNSTTSISITFTTSVDNPVLAWGGHIGDRADWGQTNSAISIPGSPYHTALVDLDGGGGSQDRSLSADAVVYPATITVIKDSVPNDAQDFAFTTTGTEMSNFSLDDDADGTLSNTRAFSITTFANNNGDTKTITEGAQSGWTLTGLVCDDANGSVDLATRTATLSVVEGEVITCTFTNTLQSAHLTLVKTVTNDNGGSAAATDWTLSASGPTPISGATGSGSVTNAEVTNGTYTLSESGGPSGYTAGSWSCTGGTQNGSDITLAAGESATCTINNNDQQAYVTVTKVVNNTHGGTAQPNNFNLTFEGNGVSSGVAVPVNPGTYTAGETQLPGYTFDGFSGNCDSNGDVTVALGESKTCSLTNSDQQAYITVVKEITNDNGGGAVPNDFALTLDGSPVLSGVAMPVNPGTYTADETISTGYNFTGFSGDCDSNGDTTVALGESKTCTLSNDDVGPSLILVKVVVNNDGGDEVESSWTLTASGPTGFSGAGPSVSNGASFDAGTYNLSESGPGGYIASDWVCVGGTQNDGDTITLELGQSATCTITNNDVPATITLTKEVINSFGGTAVAGSFTLTVDGSGVIQGAATGVDSNTSHSINENPLSGYEFISISGDALCPGVLGGTVTLDEGQNISCTITNHDLPATLVVIKHVINDNGGNAVADDFTMNVTGTDVSDASFAGEESPGTTVTLDAGSYAVDENLFPGYTKSLSTDCSGTIANGQTKTCTITNDDDPAHITLIKQVVNDDGGNASENDFGLIIGDTSVDSNQTLEVDSNTSYALNEAGLAGYEFVSLTGEGCPTELGGTVSLNEGQSITCTITNDDIAPRLKLVKNVNNNDGGEAEAGDWTLFADGSSGFEASGDSQTFQPVLAGEAYTLSESEGPVGYLEGEWDCDGGSLEGNELILDLAEDVTCTITNTFIATYSIGITKSNSATESISAGSTVTYTLNVTNNSNVALFNLEVKDFLPGGFTYVPGSTTGATTSDPSITGSTLTWNLGTILAGQTLSISYQILTASDLSNGTYINVATCKALSRQEQEKDCNEANSSVTLGSGVNFGGNLVGQVLGASTELPATGSPTLLLILSLALLGTGLFLRGYNGKKAKPTKRAVKPAKRTVRKSAKKKTRKHAKK